MVEAMANEVGQRKEFLSNNQVRTIYFGGGTPSLLNAEQLEVLLAKARAVFDVDSLAEITLEANPDDITKEKVNDWKKLGINRLSIGVQSFRQEDLTWMNRSHNAHQALQSVALVQAGGISNISLDLIYALPNLDDSDWLKNIRLAIQAGVQHVSCYCLTVEEKTKLSHLIKEGKNSKPDEDQSARQFGLLMDEMKLAGFEHYEISNFAKPSYKSQHNSNYWNGISYLGIGPSAHSFEGDMREWNISSNAAYIKGIMNEAPLREAEILTDSNKFNEMIMTKLRTAEGLNLDEVQRRFGLEKKEALIHKLERFKKTGLVQASSLGFTLTIEGKYLADDISSSLFI